MKVRKLMKVMTTENTQAKKTTHKQLVTNSGLILTTATKCKFKDSTDYSVEARMQEYEEANEDLQVKIEELQELSRKENKTNLNLLRALQCKKHLTTLSSDCDPESYIDAAYSTAESIKIIANTLSNQSYAFRWTNQKSKSCSIGLGIPSNGPVQLFKFIFKDLQHSVLKVRYKSPLKVR